MMKKLFTFMLLLLEAVQGIYAQEAYAVLSDDNTTLIFYYDNNKTSRNGMSVEPYNFSTSWGDYSGNLTTVIFDAAFANYKGLTSTEIWFMGCENLTTISGIENLNTENVEKMDCMFMDCKNLKKLDLRNFNTKNVQHMNGMFYNCLSLESLDVSSFDTENVKLMTLMFGNCLKLKSLDVSNFNTENVTDMSGMFSCCEVLETLDLSNFNTDNVTSMFAMFDCCSGLTTIYCNDAWNCNESEDMFRDCRSLVGAISYDENKINVDYANPTTGYFTKKGSSIMAEPYAVLSADNTTLTFYYDGHKASRNGIDIKPFGCGHSDDLTTVVFDATFAKYTELTSTAEWFSDCKKLTTISGIENLKTNNVKDMNSMFCGCMVLESLDVSNFNTENVTDMGTMFYHCSNLEKLDVSNFNTGNVKNMSAMFACCQKLTSLDVSNFNTENVENMWIMFYYCNNLTSLDLSNFNTKNVTDFGQMFFECNSLKTLNLCNFNTKNVTDMYEMFRYCNSLTTIYCNGSWSCGSSESMFNDCISLVGAISYDENKTDVTYANPTTGYFTAINLGDANGDGNITMSDVITIFSYILGDNPERFIKTAADVNNDGKVTVTDALMLCDMINK